VLAACVDGLVRVLLAPSCAACDAALARPLRSPVCPGCWRALPIITPPTCVRCGDALASWRTSGPVCARCRRHEPAFLIARSAGRYDGPLRALVHAFKFHGRRTLARPLGALMRDAGRDLLMGADAVVPVPLHPWRAFTRGFNQADDLARELGLPVWRALRRVRHGPPQSALPAARRHANVRAAFALGRCAALAGARQPTGRHRSVVLIDDVMTTGATLDACARVLRAAGVRQVAALTLARTAPALPAGPPRRPRPSAYAHR
jgi:ComF family protein